MCMVKWFKAQLLNKDSLVLQYSTKCHTRHHFLYFLFFFHYNSVRPTFLCLLLKYIYHGVGFHIAMQFRVNIARNCKNFQYTSVFKDTLRTCDIKLTFKLKNTKDVFGISRLARLRKDNSRVFICVSWFS